MSELFLQTDRPTVNEFKQSVEAMDLVSGGFIKAFRLDRSKAERFEFRRLTSQIWVRVREGAEVYGRNNRQTGDDIWLNRDALFCGFVGSKVELELNTSNVCLQSERVRIDVSDITWITLRSK